MKKLIVFLILAGLAGGGAYYYWYVYLPSKATPATPEVTGKVSRGPLRLTVSSTGRVVSNLDVDIKCKASGEVIKLPFDVSDIVKKDNLLVELDPVDMQRVLNQTQARLGASQAQLDIARQSLSVAERTLVTDRARNESTLKAAEVRRADARAKADRLKQLLTKSLASQEEFDTAETAAISAEMDLLGAAVRADELKTQELALELRRQDVKLAEADVESNKIAVDIAKDRLSDTKVAAPMDGIVSARNVQIGQIIASGVSNVGGGTTVLTLSDLTQVFILASVDESDIGKVQLDQAARVTVDAFAGRRFKGKVVRIATRGVNLSNVVTFEVKIEVLGEDKALLKPEMTANVEVTVAEKDDVLLAPADSVVRKGGGKSVVTLVKDDGTKEETSVTIGLSDGTVTEVLTGLTEGQTVVDRKVSEGKWAAGQRPGGPPRGGMMGGRRGGM